MTDEGPSTTPPPPVPQQQYSPGVVPERLEGPFYSTGLVILLTIVTIGIWAAVWSYRTNEDLKKFNGDGLGGVLAVVLYIFVSPVLMFTIPNEIKNAYERNGRESPVTALWGLWFLLPLIGNIIWYVKVQRALNDLWLSNGARQG
jgi:Domain of unknown function (DUF4234)